MSIGALLAILLWLLIFALIALVAWRIISRFFMDPETRNVAGLIIGFLLLVVLLRLLGVYGGGPVVLWGP